MTTSFTIFWHGLNDYWYWVRKQQNKSHTVDPRKEITTLTSSFLCVAAPPPIGWGHNGLHSKTDLGYHLPTPSLPCSQKPNIKTATLTLEGCCEVSVKLLFVGICWNNGGCCYSWGQPQRQKQHCCCMQGRLIRSGIISIKRLNCHFFHCKRDYLPYIISLLCIWQEGSDD